MNIFQRGGYSNFKDIYSYYVYDFNGDGKTDIMQVYLGNSYPNKYIVWYSKGYNLFETEAGDFPFGLEQNLINFGDFNGDGAIDIIGLENIYGTCKIFCLHDESTRQIVSSIKQDDYVLILNIGLFRS